jgi:hypothetical protein
VIIGVFVPTTEQGARLIEQPPGVQRTRIYGLCGRCLELPDKIERVETTFAAIRAAKRN